ncbi:MAG TPA: heme-dependent oxidative N-demethylase subunit alpha family protein [Methylibium sp.]
MHAASVLARMNFDFDSVTAPFRIQPGLRKLPAGARQLTALSPTSPVFAEKLAVLKNQAAGALLCEAGFDARPALRAVAAQAAAEDPAAFGWEGDSFTAWHLGWRADIETGAVERAGDRALAELDACLEPLPAASRAAALLSLALHEDLAIVDGASVRIPWLAVCLPSRWAPLEKLGRHFAEIHAPVADNALLLAAGEHLMHLVCQPQRWERFVWTITPHAKHDAHPQRHPRGPWPRDADAQALAASAWLRSERQSFIPLPERQQAVFLIHVEIQRLSDAVTTHEQAARLYAALASMSDAVLEYRGLVDARDRLLHWLGGLAS